VTSKDSAARASNLESELDALKKWFPGPDEGLESHPITLIAGRAKKKGPSKEKKGKVWQEGPICLKEVSSP